MSRRVPESAEPENEVSLISCMPDTGIAKTVKEALQGACLHVTYLNMNDEIPADRDIISCVDLETNLFENISANDLAAFQNLVRHLKTQKTLWLTKPAQVNCRDPCAAGTIGVARTVRSEREVPFHTLEIDVSEEHFSALVLGVFDKIRRATDDGDLATDKEFAVCDGVVCIGRYHPFSLKREMAERSVAGAKTTIALEIEKPGLLETLRWEERAIDTLRGD